MYYFHSPYYFLLLILIPVFYFLNRKRRQSAMRFASLSELKLSRGKKKLPIRQISMLLRTIAFGLFVTAMSRPQQIQGEKEYETKGIDIVMAIDVSGSMLAEDFKPANRLFVAKQEAKKFVQGRENDRIGLVVFARKSYTQCPLTLDYSILTQLIDDVEVGLIKDGTAIGLGVANAVNRLRDSDGKSKVIILLTDGENNAGNIDPVTAAELARSFGIKVYTIGIGRSGLVPFPIEDPIFGKRYVQAQVDVDEKTLKRIADITGGLYFSAQDANALEGIYKRIDELETTELKIKDYTSFVEKYHRFLIPGFFIFLLEILFSKFLFLRIP